MSLVLPYIASVILIKWDTDNVHIDWTIFQIFYTKYNMFNLVELAYYIEIIICCNEKLLNQWFSIDPYYKNINNWCWWLIASWCKSGIFWKISRIYCFAIICSYMIYIRYMLNVILLSYNVIYEKTILKDPSPYHKPSFFIIIIIITFVYISLFMYLRLCSYLWPLT